MAYRDDRDADQARIAALEQELATTREKLEVAEGRQALVLASQGALVRGGADGAITRWFGAPGSLQLVRRFEGAFPVDRFEELIERVREITRDPGRSELLKSSLTWFSSRGESTPRDDMSFAGRMHALGFMIGVPGEMFAVLLLSLALRRQSRWPAGALIVLAAAMWLSLAVLIPLLAAQGGLFGIPNRTLMTAYAVWLVIAAWPIATRPAPASIV